MDGRLMQRPQDRPPNRERIEEMIASLRTELITARSGHSRGPNYVTAAIRALRWVLGDPEAIQAPITGEVLADAPVLRDVSDEARAAGDVLFGRRPRPEGMLGDEVRAYQHHLYWAHTGRGAPLAVNSSGPANAPDGSRPQP